MRSFIKTLKQEEIDARPYRSLEELNQHVMEFIEEVYNQARLHSALAYCSPVEFENRSKPEETAPPWMPATLSFLRHKEIHSDGPAH